MSIKVHERDQAVVVEISGKFLGSVDGADFKETVDAIRDEGHRHVVLDLGRAEFLDSSGIGALISGHATMRKAGGDIRLANLKNRVHGLFVVTRLLGPVFKDYESVDMAIQSFEKYPPAQQPLPAEDAE